MYFRPNWFTVLSNLLFLSLGLELSPIFEILGMDVEPTLARVARLVSWWLVCSHLKGAFALPVEHLGEPFLLALALPRCRVLADFSQTLNHFVTLQINCLYKRGCIGTLLTAVWQCGLVFEFGRLVLVQIGRLWPAALLGRQECFVELSISLLSGLGNVIGSIALIPKDREVLLPRHLCHGMLFILEHLLWSVDG